MTVGGEMIRIPGSKYNAQKTVLDGIKFDSKAESKYYANLLFLKKAGEVITIDIQPVFELQPAFDKNGKNYQAITYRADFRVTYADGRVEIVDVKGVKTETFDVKRKMFEYHYPDLTLTII